MNICIHIVDQFIRVFFIRVLCFQITSPSPALAACTPLCPDGKEFKEAPNFFHLCIIPGGTPSEPHYIGNTLDGTCTGCQGGVTDGSYATEAKCTADPDPQAASAGPGVWTPITCGIMFMSTTLEAECTGLNYFLASGIPAPAGTSYSCCETGTGSETGTGTGTPVQKSAAAQVDVKAFVAGLALAVGAVVMACDAF